MRRLIILGAGGQGRSVAEIVLRSADLELVSFFDDAYSEKYSALAIPVMGPICGYEQFLEKADCWFVAIGNKQTRAKLCRSLLAIGCSLTTLIHPSAIVSARADIGEGAVLMAGAIIGVDARLGMGSVVNRGAVLDHDCILGTFSYMGVGAAMVGGAVLGDYAWMQANSPLGAGALLEAGKLLMPGQVAVQ